MKYSIVGLLGFAVFALGAHAESITLWNEPFDNDPLTNSDDTVTTDAYVTVATASKTLRTDEVFELAFEGIFNDQNELELPSRSRTRMKTSRPSPIQMPLRSPEINSEQSTGCTQTKRSHWIPSA